MKLLEHLDLTELGDCSECRQYFIALRKDFEARLSEKLSKRTVNKHIVIISCLTDFLCFDCGVRCLDDLTVGMVNSRFRRWYGSKIADATESEVKTAVRKFFLFLAEEKGFNNEKILISIRK
ncbi:hypothetical protein [uncultured Thiodictyon sp.]|uniref:hypothetical protein n=1 Tax=uncultured Thiodictyon sp. TaxID=1846217 RepID=UPI0025EDA779|nr:hypothetical protein [uncultured Thiodictyon sp.]